MKSWLRLSLVIVILHVATGSYAQWLPAEGMEGAYCDQLFLIDSTLVTHSTPYGISIRHVDSSCWKQDHHIDMMGWTVAGQVIVTYLYEYLYRSFDYGETWDTVELTNLSAPICLTGVDSVIFFYEYGATIARSNDYGTSWDLIPSPSPLANQLYLFSHDSSLFCQDYPATAIFESTDHGNSWTTIPLTGLPSDIYLSCLDVCHFGGTWWAAPGNGIGGIYKFSVANNSWTCMNDTLAFDHFAVLSNVLYGYGTGIWQLNSNYNAWIPRSDGLTCSKVTGLVSIDTMVFCVSEDGPFRTTSIFSWLPFMTGLHGGGVYCISSLDNEVWAGWNDDLYLSSDYGTSFSKVDNYPGQGYGMKFIMTDSLFYLKDQYSFYISYDHGNSWIEEMSGIPPNPVGNFQDFSVGDHFLFAACQNQLYRSAVFPVYWEPAPIPPFEHMSTVQANNSTVVMAGPSNFPIFITHDNGNSFDTLSFTIPGNYPILRYGDGRFYAFASTDIWFSCDNGYTWDTIPLEMDDFRITDLASNDEAMISTGYWYYEKSCNFHPKVFISYDEGQNWVSIVENLEHCGSSSFSSMYINENRILLGSDFNGLWYRDDLLTGSKQEVVFEKNEIKIFPNPAHTSFSIQIDKTEGHLTGIVSIRSLTGQIVVQPENIVFENGTTATPIDISRLIPGIYLVSVYSDSHPPLHSKLIRH